MLGLVLAVGLIVCVIIGAILDSRNRQLGSSQPLVKEKDLVLQKNTAEKVITEVAEKPSPRECPFCCEPIKAAAVKCPHCGESLGRHLYTKQDYPIWSIYRLEWLLEAITLRIKNSAFFEVLDYVSRLSVIIVVVFWFLESGERTRQSQLQAWQVISFGSQIGGGIATVQALELLNCTDSSWFCSPVSFRGLKLENITLPALDLHGANLYQSDLGNTDMYQADLSNTNMTGAQVSDANLSNADLSHANLTGAILSNADLTGAQVGDANLMDADLTGAILRGAKYNKNTYWPKGFDPQAAGAILVEP